MSGPGTSTAKTATRENRGPKLDIDRTRERLTALGCAHAAEQLGDVLDGAVAQGEPSTAIGPRTMANAPQAFLDRLLEVELAGREGEAMERQWSERHWRTRVRTALKLSNLPTGQTLESVDFVLPKIDPLDRFLHGRTPARDRALAHRNLGDRGVGPRQGDGAAAGPASAMSLGPMAAIWRTVGKTHLAVSLGVKAVQLGFSAQYYRFDELMTALKGDADMPPNRLRRRKYMSTALLIIDGEGLARHRFEGRPERLRGDEPRGSLVRHGTRTDGALAAHSSA